LARTWVRALEAGIASGDVILTVLARRRFSAGGLDRRQPVIEQAGVPNP
jgi:hypothetical protein